MAAAAAETPRITSRYLDAFAGKHIRIVGKVTELRGTEATIDSEGAVKVFLSPVGVFPFPPFFQSFLFLSLRYLVWGVLVSFVCVGDWVDGCPAGLGVFL